MKYPAIGSEKWLDLLIWARSKRPATLSDNERRALEDAAWIDYQRRPLPVFNAEWMESN
jgi:hypothetical protein